MKITRLYSKVGPVVSGELFHRRSLPALIGIACVCLLTIILLLQPTSEASALPEYSVQTGEPCATCHISPSGGGPRGPRGPAWVGEGKPGAVPGLIEALESLGVHLEVDEAFYKATPEAVAPAGPLQLTPAEVEKIHNWLSDYNGN